MAAFFFRLSGKVEPQKHARARVGLHRSRREVTTLAATTRRVNPAIRGEDVATMLLAHADGATSVVEVTDIEGEWRGTDLGALAPVEPSCRFGFSSTPRRPSVTSVVTTIERPV